MTAAMIERNTPAAPRVGWDGIGMTASGLCIGHCILTPILLFAVPIAGLTVLEDEWIHKGLVALVIAIGVVALVPGLRLHRHFRMLPLVLLGAGSLLFAAFAAKALWGEAGETAFTMVGGGLMVYSHWKNRLFCKACRECCAGQTCQPESAGG